jgi:hypothetical protein
VRRLASRQQSDRAASAVFRGAPGWSIPLLILALDVSAACKSDCREELASETESCQYLHGKPEQSEALARCVEKVNAKYSLAAGKVRHCVVNNRTIYTDRQSEASCQPLDVPSTPTDPNVAAGETEKFKSDRDQRPSNVAAPSQSSQRQPEAAIWQRNRRPVPRGPREEAATPTNR